MKGDPLEIFVDRDGEVILKKYSPISELGNFAKEYTEALYDSLGHNVLVCDRDSIIAVAGASKKEYLNKSVGDLIEKTMEERKSVIMTDESEISIIDGVTEKVSSYTIGSIIANGDPIGAVVIFSKEAIISEVEHKSVNTAASFLAKQMEQ